MDKRTRTLNQAHARIDGMEKEVVEIKTTMKLSLKELYARIRRLEMILIAITGASLLLLLRMNFLGEYNKATPHGSDDYFRWPIRWDKGWQTAVLT